MGRGFWFGAAWTFLVVVVAFGFLVQAQTIDSLHETQDRQEALLVLAQQEQMRDTIAICDITYRLHPDDEQMVTQIFADHNITCPGH